MILKNKSTLNWQWGIIAILALLPLISLFYNPQQLPRGDEWDTTIPFILQYHQGIFDWHLLWAHNNEHRLVLVKLLYLLAALWFNASFLPVLGLAYFVLLTTLYLFYRAVTAQEKLVKNYPCLLLFIAVLWLNPRCYGPLHWAFLIQQLLVVFFFVLTLLTFHRAPQRWSTTSLVIIFSILAELSMADGLVIWWIMLGFMVLGCDP